VGIRVAKYEKYIIFILILEVKCYYIPASERTDCRGDVNTCERLNCCWSPLSRGVDGPWCYNRPGFIFFSILYA